MIAAVFLALVGLLLCFVPLASLLGYESAAAMGAVAGLTVLIRTLRMFADGRLRSPIDPSWHRGPAATFFDLLPTHLAMLIAPALLLTLNALRVPNCDLWLGVQFWLVIPSISVVIAQTLAYAVAVLPRGRGIAAAVLLLMEIGRVLWRLTWHPAVTGHEWLIGYFSGSIYDEALSLPTSLLWSRLMLLAGCATVLLTLEVAWHRRSGKPHGPLIAGLVAAALVYLAISTNRLALNIEVDRLDATEILSGRLETEHFIIHYDPGSLLPDQRELIADDHEFHFDRHVEFFGFDPVDWRGRKMTTFVYPDRNTQKRILGTRNTQVARPWTHEMHIRWGHIGEGSLGHEMSHLFSAQFGAGPLQLPTRGGMMPDIGLLEGIAEAADWPAEELPAHHAVAAMRQLDIAPNLRHIFKPTGFWSQPSGKAYTMMGSFVRYLIETHGIEKFKTVYGEGDFEGVYGQSVGALITDWELFIDGFTLSQTDLEFARVRYSRRSIFDRICARSIGELRRQADIASHRGEPTRSREIWEQIVAFEPGSASHRISLASALADEQDDAAALRLVEDLLTWDLSPNRIAQVNEQKGNLLWRADRHSEAAAAYTASLTAGLSDAAQRRLQVKQVTAAASDSPAAELARHYLLDGPVRSDALYTLMRWSELAPADPLPRYLVGLTLARMNKPGEAARWLDTAALATDEAPAPELPTEQLELQRRIMLADALRLSGDTVRADALYTELSSASSHRIVRLAELGRQRVAWQPEAP